MNVTKLSFTQAQDQFDLSTGFEVLLIDGNRTPVSTPRPVEKAAVIYDAAGARGTLPLPEDLFEGIPTGAYFVGVRPVNEGGPSTWVFSPAVHIVGEPASVTDVAVE